MNNAYRIYFGENSYWIISEAESQLRALATEGDTVILNNPDLDSIKASIEDIDADIAKTIILHADNVEKYWQLFQQQFILIQAGGGLVKNEQDEYLFIFRRGKWDLPKGKLDDGETISQCALREVNEETGLQFVTLGYHLCNTYHTYHERGQFILKESVWYAMSCRGQQNLKPQTEEDILELLWLPKDRWKNILNNTFPSIKDVLTTANDTNF